MWVYICVKIHKKKVWKHVYQTEKVISFGRGWGGGDWRFGDRISKETLICIVFTLSILMCLCVICIIKNKQIGTSLVVQWLRICLPMQGTGVRALVREDPTCRGATKPVRHNY